MASTVWKGHLTFGLVSVPVRLFRAARRERISFHQLYRREQPGPCGHERQAPGAIPTATPSEPETDDPAPVERVRQGLFAREDQSRIPRNEIVKGYEFEKGRYVVIEKEEIDKITPKTATGMEIVEFVRLSEIDPIYLETSYYVSPEGSGEKPYALLFEALRESGYVALAEFAMRRRQHAVVLRPGSTGIIAHTMYYADEIRKGEEFRTNTGLASKKERDLAITLIEAMAAPFEPEKFKDTFREKLGEIISAKLQGKEISAEQASPEPAPAADIIQALQESLAMRRKPMASAPSQALKGRKKARA
jgi:DNA end-binding protein Ku